VSARLAELRRLLVHRPAGLALLLGLTMLRLLTTGGLRSAVATEVYLLAVTAVVLTWCFQVLVKLPAPDRLWARAERRAEAKGRPVRLEVLEEGVTFWVRSSYQQYRRLRPAVRDLAGGRLRRAGIDLDHDPRAPLLLGRTGWSIVDPDAGKPLDDDATPLSPVQMQDLTRALTALSRPGFAAADPSFAAGEQTGEQH
jgi:hypothetical protein